MNVGELDDHLPPVGGEGIDVAAANSNDATSGLPLAAGMSYSLWLQTVRNDPLLNHRTTVELPSEADIVIIGSGITGSVTALSLLQSPTPPKSILMLEAREMCSGATGRNAGHCKPDQGRGFTKYSQAFGAEEALKTWESLVAYVKKHNVDCDLWVGKTLDVAMTNDVAQTAANTFADYQRAGGDVSKIEVITEPSEAEKVSRLTGAKSIYAWDASTLHPWKLVAHVNRQSLNLGLNLQTWTPVTSVTGSEHQWTVHTERGKVETPIVIHATNAYAGVLLPEVIGPIQPCPHMCNKVLPPSSFSGTEALKNSYAVMYPTGLYTINSRPTSDGILLFGGAAPNQYKLVEYVEEAEQRRTDDSLVNFEPVTQAVRKLGTEGFQWGTPQTGARGAHVRYDESWSGIIGRSADQVPFVGAVPDKPGQWMCCGHNGHGMARIFTCAPALAKLIQGATWSETGIPKSFQVSTERLDKLRAKLINDRLP